MVRKEAQTITQTTTVLTRSHLSFCDTSVKALTAWMHILSLQPLGDTSERLLNALNELTELDDEETLRYDLIQVLHPLIEQVLMSIVDHALQLGPADIDRKNHMIELSNRLRLRFIHLYIDMVNRSEQQLSQVKHPFLNFGANRNLINVRLLSTFFGLRQIARLLILQQKNFDHCLVDQWISTHRLYQLAYENGEHLININQLQGSNYPLSNIHQVYIQNLLLNILYTYQVRPVEIESLFHCTAEWIHLVRLTKHETLYSRYSINTKQDAPPQFKSRYQHPVDADLFLSTQDLLKHINDTVQYGAKSMSEVEKKYLTPALQFHIQNVLGTNHAERRHQRFEHSAELEIFFTVQAAHYYLSQGQSIIQKDNFPSLYPKPENFQMFTTNVLDISSQGYRIYYPNALPHLLNIGELILLKENTDPDWKVGVIRWKKQYVMNSYSFGVEVLATQLQACSVTSVVKNIDFQSMDIPSLILFQRSFGQSHFSLIIPNIPHLLQQATLQLKLAEQSYIIQPTQKLLETQSFIQFNFKLDDPTLLQHILKQLQR